MRGRRKLQHHRPLYERAVVFVSGNYPVGMRLGSLFYELKKRAFFLLSVDDKYAVENFVATVLGVYLRKAKYLTVGELSAQLLAQAFQVSNFFVVQCQALLPVVCSDIVDK